jgi:hypothetical protein
LRIAGNYFLAINIKNWIQEIDYPNDIFGKTGQMNQRMIKKTASKLSQEIFVLGMVH